MAPNWLRRVLGLHVHKWGPTETFEIGGDDYWCGDLHIVVAKRTMHWQECATCGQRDFVYPPSPLRIRFARGGRASE